MVQVPPAPHAKVTRAVRDGGNPSMDYGHYHLAYGKNQDTTPEP